MESTPHHPNRRGWRYRRYMGHEKKWRGRIPHVISLIAPTVVYASGMTPWAGVFVAPVDVSRSTLIKLSSIVAFRVVDPVLDAGRFGIDNVAATPHLSCPRPDKLGKSVRGLDYEP